MRIAAILAIGALAVSLAGCNRPDAAFDARVKTYLMAHPEVLRAALENMQRTEEAAQVKAEASDDLKAQAALPGLRAALERDPRDFAANPGGRITVTEFYDYRCPHCIDIAPKVVSLIRDHPEIRVVFKEMPIFGDTSEHAARAALAAKAQGKDYVGLYEALMSTRPLTDDAIDRLAVGKGVNLTEMNAPANVAKANAQLADTAELARKLAIQGTPGFVVGDAFVRGADEAGLAAAIAAAQRTG
jgi:protein-disulfide isomerase